MTKSYTLNIVKNDFYVYRLINLENVFKLHLFSNLFTMDVEKKTMEYLFQVEKQAEKILVDKSEIIALDKRRNNNRMAIRALINNKTPQEKTWIAVGPCLVKVSIEKAKDMLQKGIHLSSYQFVLYNVNLLNYIFENYFQSK